MQVQLASDIDLAGFRAAARTLLAQQVPPQQAHWRVAGAVEVDLFEAPAEPAHFDPAAPAANQPAATVPASFVRLCGEVVLHCDPERFARLYQLLWRLVHEPGLRDDPIDPDMLHAQQMAQAVRRDMHKMKAFVRFRQVQDAGSADRPLHVAWFEPTHHIVDAVAPWFAQRFTQMRWAILTPKRCAAWDGAQLSFGPGAARADAPPADAGEALWLTYYQSIFNPARLKLKMMQKEMPRKYWHNLPEARLIAPLAASAGARSDNMVQQWPSVPARRISRAVVQRDVASPPMRIETLAQVKEATMRCRECPIGEHATQSVTGEGPRKARLMFVGEQPGDQEDLRGHPFIGPAGQLFDRALAQLGLPRDQVFVSNAVKHFKFELRGKRRIHKTPTQREAQACAHWLEDEIRLVQPAALVALGATAARSLMGHAVAVTAARGQWLVRSDGWRVLITLHPSALLRMPPEEKEAAYAAFFADLSKARALFDQGELR
jgi:uracil-DNA glycosylase